VDIILTNNGYTVYNLGIKQPIANVISAWREHEADAIGLSGLLVKSTVVMREDLQVLNEHGITAPVILGGAALTRRYVEDDLRPRYKGPLHYARDAFDGLRLMGEIAELVSGAVATTAAAEPGVPVEPPGAEQLRRMASSASGSSRSTRTRRSAPLRRKRRSPPAPRQWRKRRRWLRV